MKISILDSDGIGKHLEALEPLELSLLARSWIEWSKKSDIQVMTADFSLMDQKFKHYLVTLTGENSKQFFGHGRSAVAELGFVKAIHEAIERMAMQTYFSEHSDLSGVQKFMWNPSAPFDRALTSSNHQPVWLPTKGMRSSNGWAVSTTLSDAIDRSLKESIERHSLQMQFWNSQLDALRLQGSVTSHDETFHLAWSETGISEYINLVVGLSYQDFPGLIFGHQTCRKAELSEALASRTPLDSLWLHSMIEAFQLADGLKLNPDNSNPFDQIKREFAKDEGIKENLLSRPKSTLNFSGTQSPEIPLNVVALDLRKGLNLSFPLYAVWTFSDAFAPLYIEQLLSDEEKNIFLKHVKSLDPTIAKLCRTPFV